MFAVSSASYPCTSPPETGLSKTPSPPPHFWQHSTTLPSTTNERHTHLRLNDWLPRFKLIYFVLFFSAVHHTKWLPMVCDLWYSVGLLHPCGNHHAVPGTLYPPVCLKAHGPLWTAAPLESVSSFYNDWTVFKEESRRNSVALGDQRRIKNKTRASSPLCSPHRFSSRRK